MAIDIDWIARLRTQPSKACPADAELRAFVRNPEGVTPASFSHIIRGCVDCREKLQEIVLHPSTTELMGYLRDPNTVPEETLMHVVGCESCQRRAREALDGD